MGGWEGGDPQPPPAQPSTLRQPPYRTAMSASLPDDDRDLRLARRLDSGAAPDGTDALDDALRAARPEASAVEAGTSARLWARVAGEIGADRPAAMPAARDRAPLRLVRTPAVRWLAAAVVLVALGVGMWTVQRGPDLVAAAEDEIVTYEAPDGSTITLRPNSRLVRVDGSERAYRLDGEAFFAVARDPERPFTVEAGLGTVRVLGTRFDVSTWGGRAEVFVEEGRVEVSAAASTLVLTAGEAAAATDNGVAPVPDATAEAFLDWRRGEAAFESETVQRVADEIGQHFGVRITLPADVARRSVSGVIALESAPQALDGLGRILGGRFEPVDGGYRFAR